MTSLDCPTPKIRSR